MPPKVSRHCIRCGCDPGYNRAVIDLVANEKIGSLCRNCELDALSDSDVFERGSTDGTCGCPGCARDATVSFPRWLPETTVSEDAVESHVDYELDDDPLALCDEHFDNLASGSAIPAPSPRAASEHR